MPKALETNKTKVRYKDVDIGEVRDIRVGDDRKEVIVTADIHRNARPISSTIRAFGWCGREFPAPAYRAWPRWYRAPTSAWMWALCGQAATTSSAWKSRPS